MGEHEVGTDGGGPTPHESATASTPTTPTTPTRGRRRRGGGPRARGGAPRTTDTKARGSDRADRGDRRDHGGEHRPEQVDAQQTARVGRKAQVRRAVVVPPIHYPPDLPVSARRDDISATIRDHQVVIVSGETGSGKTTQLPKILLELGRGRAGQIGHTQPRRIAARTVAERIAEEIGTPLGEIVGYQVRFTDTSSDGTLVRVMTDGILLAQIQRDPMLRAYDTLIIDEAHERSLNIDFILGYLTRLLPQRPDLKVVITSATIDSARFAEHFASADGAPAPVVEVTGRTYPVEIRYRPLTPDPPEAGAGAPAARAPKQDERDPLTAVCEAVDELCAEGPGDILVFFSGEREIRDAEDALVGHLGPRVADQRRSDSVEIIPLYSRLSSAEQHKVFERHSTRRVVLATNVAETSLTVPGIRYVVDPGTARISRFSKATKVQRLPIEPISQASANQRAGRCGRVADGIAIRLYSEADFESRPEFTEPEILRTSLAAVILQMVAVGVASTPDDVAKFPFVEPPDTRSIRDGVQLLTELGALEGVANGPGARLTEVGRALAQLPMDPRLGRMIVEGGRRGVAREVIIIAAALSIQDPRERPLEQRQQADQLHARFADPTSDFLTYLNLWEHVKDSQRELSSSAFRRMCRNEHLNYMRLREWQDVVTQLRQMAKPLGIRVEPPAPRSAPDAAIPAATSSGPTGATSSAPAAPRRRTAPGAAQTQLASDTGPDPTALRLDWDGDRIHVSLLSGLLSQLGMQEVTEVRAAAAHPQRKPPASARKGGRNEYLGARGARFAIFPGSPLSRKPPAWIMVGELVETSRLWGRDAARIQPEWAEDLAAHLVKRTYSDPAWSTKQGAAMASEKVLLYGVPIVAQRRVLYAKVDPEHARELFIRHALVDGEWTTHHAFFHDNRALLAEAESLEHRARRRDLVVDDDALYAFYDERVPADVVSARHFDTWWRTAQRTEPDLLDFTLAMLVPDTELGAVSETDFPDVWPQGDLELPLTYQFEPGTDADGVTVHLPVVVLNRVRPEGFDQMVPGVREELVVALIRSLAKPVRVQLVPAPDVARDVVGWIDANLPSWLDTVRAGDMAGSMHDAVAAAVRELRGVEIPADAWDDERLPAHLRMTFRVEEERGSASVVVDEGKDLVVLQRRLAAHTQDAVRVAVRSAVRDAVRESARESARAATAAGPTTAGGRAAPVGTTAGGGPRPSAPARPAPGSGAGAGSAGNPETSAAPAIAERTALTTWPTGLDGGRIPDLVETPVAGGLTVRGYPALVEERGPARELQVSLRVLADPARQAAAHARGLRRLLLLETGLATARITSRWSGTQALTLAASPYRSTPALVADVQLATVGSLLDAAAPTAGVRDLVTYTRVRDQARGELEDAVHRTVADVVTVLTAARELDGAVRAATSLALLNTLQDIREQSAALVHDGFVAEAGAARLPHLARYLRAARHRLTKAAQDPNRDAEIGWRIRDLEDAYAQARQRAASAAPDPVRDAALAEVRWMLEELRVSLFAQQLGTPTPISEKRIRAILT
ncbi:ATP-dependent RNA helicase HrpA [Pengzhenrongella sicca]|uniref:ATP-dependent RNA helicase HrpA n=1 Tax=Pengzhenrongella sicca TaxID=2819238 RepID=A0A8A4ZEW2_9MICO|nr:ATP-dependent RNA helicase HrpA [Pengzhenrongella sicca]QTE29549.1 ATP-dependent RNA helicase HrpA [Pengzhenrongella sicca]